MKSMTGFGSAEYSSENFEVNIILKTVNNKFLDIKSSLPEEFYQYEQSINKLIEKYIKRGTVYLKIQLTNKETEKYELNEKKIEKIDKIFNEIIKKTTIKNISVSLDNLVEKYELIKMKAEKIEQEKIQIILSTIEKALQKHQEMANNEGENMKKFISKSIKKIEKALQRIIKDYPNYKENLKSRLTDALKDISSQPYEKETMQRFMVELSFYIEKYDVSEELLRLNSHIKLLKSAMKQKEPIGKKMNFILQEMKREINTTSSKYSDMDIFKDIIIIKEEIEKIREIIQNVE